MSLRVDLEQALESLRATLHRLDDDIVALEKVITEHFNLNAGKVPANVLREVEKEIKVWPGEIKP